MFEIQLLLRAVGRIPGHQDVLFLPPTQEALLPAVIYKASVGAPNPYSNAQGAVLTLLRQPPAGIPAGPVELIVQMNEIALFPGLLCHLAERVEVALRQVLPPVHSETWMGHGLEDSLPGHFLHLGCVNLPIHLSVQEPERGLGTIPWRIEKAFPKCCCVHFHVPPVVNFQ